MPSERGACQGRRPFCPYGGMITLTVRRRVHVLQYSRFGVDSECGEPAWRVKHGEQLARALVRFLDQDRILG